jgi:hypothetical protein
VGAASGRIDALVFMAGLIAGVWAFAEVYVVLAGFVESGALGDVTLADLLDVPFWVVAAALLAVALVTFWLLARLERRRGPDAT